MTEGEDVLDKSDAYKPAARPGIRMSPSSPSSSRASPSSPTKALSVHRLFVSDLHLSDDTPDIEAAFTGLLKQESALDSLVMLGDVFEAWVGDDDDSPLADRVKLALRALAESGTEILFTRGNRDFMLGQQFASDIGGTLFPDQTVLDVAGHPTLVLTATPCARTMWTTSSSDSSFTHPTGRLK